MNNATVKAELDLACSRFADALDARRAYDARMARVITPKSRTLYTVRRGLKVVAK